MFCHKCTYWRIVIKYFLPYNKLYIEGLFLEGGPYYRHSVYWGNLPIIYYANTWRESTGYTIHRNIAFSVDRRVVIIVSRFIRSAVWLILIGFNIYTMIILKFKYERSAEKLARRVPPYRYYGTHVWFRAETELV